MTSYHDAPYTLFKLANVSWPCIIGTQIVVDPGNRFAREPFHFFWKFRKQTLGDELHKIREVFG